MPRFDFASLTLEGGSRLYLAREVDATINELVTLMREAVTHVDSLHDADPQADTFHWLKGAREALKDAPWPQDDQ